MLRAAGGGEGGWDVRDGVVVWLPARCWCAKPTRRDSISRARAPTSRPRRPHLAPALPRLVWLHTVMRPTPSSRAVVHRTKRWREGASTSKRFSTVMTSFAHADTTPSVADRPSSPHGARSACRANSVSSGSATESMARAR